MDTPSTRLRRMLAYVNRSVDAAATTLVTEMISFLLNGDASTGATRVLTGFVIPTAVVCMDDTIPRTRLLDSLADGRTVVAELDDVSSLLQDNDCCAGRTLVFYRALKGSDYGATLLRSVHAIVASARRRSIPVRFVLFSSSHSPHEEIAALVRQVPCLTVRFFGLSSGPTFGMVLMLLAERAPVLVHATTLEYLHGVWDARQSASDLIYAYHAVLCGLAARSNEANSKVEERAVTILLEALQRQLSPERRAAIFLEAYTSLSNGVKGAVLRTVQSAGAILSDADIAEVEAAVPLPCFVPTRGMTVMPLVPLPLGVSGTGYRVLTDCVFEQSGVATQRSKRPPPALTETEPSDAMVILSWLRTSDAGGYTPFDVVSKATGIEGKRLQRALAELRAYRAVVVHRAKQQLRLVK